MADNQRAVSSDLVVLLPSAQGTGMHSGPTLKVTSRPGIQMIDGACRDDVTDRNLRTGSLDKFQVHAVRRKVEWSWQMVEAVMHGF